VVILSKLGSEPLEALAIDVVLEEEYGYEILHLHRMHFA
jgi:hypothetical protein